MEGTNTKQRMDSRQGYLQWLDEAKGFGVFLVVLGHLWYGSSLPLVNQVIYSFHVPFFFLLSGFVIRCGKQRPLPDFFTQKWRRLLLPALLYIAITIPVYFLADHPSSISQVLRDLSFVNGSIPYNSPCWFLIVLFEVQTAERLLDLANRPALVKGCVAAAAFALGGAVYQCGVWLPFGLDKALIAMGFFTLGMLFRHMPDAVSAKQAEGAVILLLAVVWWAAGMVWNGKVSMYEMQLDHYAAFILSGSCGSILFLLLFRRLMDRESVLTTIGQNSVLIIGTHVAFSVVFHYAMRTAGWENTGQFSIAALLTAVAICLLYIPVSAFVNRYIPWFAGKPGRGKTQK